MNEFRPRPPVQKVRRVTPLDIAIIAIVIATLVYVYYRVEHVLVYLSRSAGILEQILAKESGVPL